VQFRQASDQRQADAQSADGTLRTEFATREQIEHPGQKSGGNPNTVVFDAQRRLFTFGMHADQDFAPWGRVL
jgi:hypothetical protein